MTSPATAASMADYYARRAGYYERVYRKPERQGELRAMETWLAPQFKGRRVLEIACGTGWWTPHGARQAQAWLATDLKSAGRWLVARGAEKLSHARRGIGDARGPCLRSAVDRIHALLDPQLSPHLT